MFLYSPFDTMVARLKVLLFLYLLTTPCTGDTDGVTTRLSGQTKERQEERRKKKQSLRAHTRKNCPERLPFFEMHDPPRLASPAPCT